MISKMRFLLLPALAVVAIVVFAVASASGSGTPKWYVGGSELSGNESYAGVAEPSTLAVDGVTTKCEHSYYVSTIFNSAGQGKGELTSLPLYECSASGHECKLTKNEPIKLPWPMHDVFVGTKPYLVIEKVAIEVAFSGAGCPLAGTHEVTGSLGGLVENSTQKAVFNSTTESATGTSLKVATFPVEFTGSYTVEAVGPERRGQLVEAK